MSTIKASHYIRLLDTARCTGDWDSVPELCRKIRKHAPGRKCLVLVAEAERNLRNIPPPPPGSSKPTIASYVASLNALRDPILDEIESHPRPLPKLPVPAGGGEPIGTTEEDLLQGRITVAWVSSLKSEWQEVLDVVPGEDEVGEGSTAITHKSDYLEVLRIKALVIKGMALSHTTPDHSHPLQVYRAATRLPSSANYTNEQRALPAFVMWTEKALAHYAMAAYRCWMESHTATPDSVQRETLNGGEDGDSNGAVGVAIGNTIVDELTVANAFRAYHNFVAAAPVGTTAVGVRPSTANRRVTKEKDDERREVYRRYFKFLSLILLPWHHPQRPHATTPSSSQTPTADTTVSGASRRDNRTKAGTKENLQKELKQIQAAYQEYLMRSIGFPKADEYHAIIGEWIDQVVQNWEVSGGSGEEAAEVVAILYSAAKRTFHSPRVLRFLSITLTASGNFSDALAALNTYMDLVEKAKERIAKGHHEKDMDSDLTIFETVVEGVRVMCKFMNKGHQVKDKAVRMEKWIKEWRIRDKTVLAVAHRGIGMAYALWSRVAPDGEQRVSSKNTALESFKKALHYDSGDIQCWYGLALLQGEIGQVDDAVESVRRGLGVLKANYLDVEEREPETATRDYKRWAVSLLHLYALLTTAKDDFDQAIRICENAFEIVGDGREAVSDLGVYDKIAVFELEITHLAIIEAAEDRGVAISTIDRILTLYGVLFDGAHLVQRVEHSSNPEERVFDSAASSRPQTTASRRSRLFGVKLQKKQYSASTTNLSQSGNELQAPPGTAASRRPVSNHQDRGFARSPPPVNAPTIQVTEPANATASSNRKSSVSRPDSVSGGPVKRMRSLSSLRIKGPDHHRKDESPTPPLPSSTEASSLNFGGSGSGRDPHLFHMLKSKLHLHQLEHAGESGPASSSTSVNLESPSQQDESAETVVPKQNTTKAEALPNNLPQKKLPFPINAIGRALPEDAETGKTRSIHRPLQLPEPKLVVDEERRRVLGTLRKAWLWVAGMYRRAGYFQDAAMAIGEAEGLVSKEADGEADVLTEKGYLALAQSQPLIASDFFEAALALELDHPYATIGLSRILIATSTTDPAVETTATPPRVADWSLPATPTTTRSSFTDPDDAIDDPEMDDAALDRLAARDRALGLLEKLVGSVKGWNSSEAWMLLSEVLEKTGEIDRAKQALWKVIELEDATGVRGFAACGSGVV